MLTNRLSSTFSPVRVRKLFLIAVSLFVVSFNSPYIAAQDQTSICNLGRVIDAISADSNCKAKRYSFGNTEAVITIEFEDDNSLPNKLKGQTQEFNLKGPAVIKTENPAVIKAGALEIKTEMVSMDLTGNGINLIAGSEKEKKENSDRSLLAPGTISVGGIPRPIEIFRIPFEITVSQEISGLDGDIILYNKDPVEVSAQITQFPPYGSQFTVNPVDLYLNDRKIARLTRGRHWLPPPPPPPCPPFCPQTPTLSEWGLIIFTLLLLTVATRFIVRHQVTLNTTTGTLPPNNIPLLTPIVFRKALIITSLLFLIGSLLALGLSYSPSSVDMVGSLISVFILAYLLHLLMLLKR